MRPHSTIQPNRNQAELSGGDPDGNRTRVTAVKGRCLNRLTTGPQMRPLLEARGSGSRI